MQRKPINKKECKEELSFLDYLRKSQCTMTADYRWGDPLGIGNTPKKNNACIETLTQMEELSKECLEFSGFKFKR